MGGGGGFTTLDNGLMGVMKSLLIWHQIPPFSYTITVKYLHILKFTVSLSFTAKAVVLIN